MSEIQTCQDLSLCSSEILHAYRALSDDDVNGDHADDATWILSASFIILTMQSGFGLLEMGSAVAGNEVNIMMKNAADVIFGSLSYYLLGYGISFGKPSNPFMGLGDFAPDSDYLGTESGLLYSKYIFHFSFAATATTIVSGMVTMRMRFFVYCWFSFVAIIFYAFPAHWMWASDGWLLTMGAYDFAGGGPVHLFGGVNGLVAIYLLGPRTGRFDGTRPRSDFRPVSHTSILFGLFMLWWGWIGFNCGSTFGITGDKWIVATRAAIVTINATGAGGVVAIAYSMFKSRGKILKVEDVVNGILGALVTTSAVCSVIHTYESLLLGAVGALVALAGNKLVLRMQLDDVVGAAGVHAGAGIWGLISVGLFADGDLPGVDVSSGLFRGGGMHLLGLQLLAIVVISAWACMFSFSFFYLTGIAISKNWKNPRAGLRVSRQEEKLGADFFLHGVSLFDDEEDEDSIVSSKEDPSCEISVTENAKIDAEISFGFGEEGANGFENESKRKIGKFQLSLSKVAEDSDRCPRDDQDVDFKDDSVIALSLQNAATQIAPEGSSPRRKSSVRRKSSNNEALRRKSRETRRAPM
uniref:Ammonium transporter AmtB-like domain-containing protein n=1 Tax=Pseudictyota dubia TaxID=2749911 RepID=A0A7R9VS26_9STRA|mmetsp:Transcript_22119/g.41216  ORF Transcript_22119/g.41216 Transcript_22119/m.41216 type:complete len:581 (+) Transcript_22119:212-1954(+)|eukprot:CAMPEP_0197437998 /NCGR_PEP_ID=MMETSP1175-20131217/5103_1 /TAXON_ID=1003142 /ORGANISM="Triceratium dubium, Strain CCMP147" /LENGTH=580 /DNA_ID=CAMNT_0042967645 /DNA_START=201 /DNA_END=1943 /DNA_ORIENTATION=+